MEEDYEPEIDGKARQAYGIRIEDLERKLVDGNPEETFEIKEEIIQLKAILSRKGRKIRSKKSENSRSNVTKRIKEALQKIYSNESVAYLERYLNKATIQRGRKNNIYQPNPNDKPRWILHKNELPS